MRVVFAELEEDVVTRSMMISIERRGAAEAVRSMTWPRPRAAEHVAHHPLGRLPRARFTGGDGVDRSVSVAVFSFVSTDSVRTGHGRNAADET